MDHTSQNVLLLIASIRPWPWIAYPNTFDGSCLSFLDITAAAPIFLFIPDLFMKTLVSSELMASLSIEVSQSWVISVVKEAGV